MSMRGSKNMSSKRHGSGALYVPSRHDEFVSASTSIRSRNAETATDLPGMAQAIAEDTAAGTSIDVSSASLDSLAKVLFDKEAFNLWDVCEPIAVRGLSLKKDVPRGCFGQQDDGEMGIPGAPNFATAILGRWVATKLRLTKPPPPPRPQDASHSLSPDNSTSSQFVFTDVNALLLPGESTLLLGPSSSGKTTLLRTLSDLISGKEAGENVEGSLLIGGRNPATSGQNLSRTTAFVDQSDLTLTPILTVEETVRFARACADPDDPENFERYLQAMLRLVGLDHVKDTVVGNADIRGVSGGQKRRVKLLEMAVGNEVLATFFDEVTNGLDAASALSICQSIRTAVEGVGNTSVTSLLQPSTEAFETFHRVIVLTQDGRVAYSGKREGAVEHFQSLGLTKPKEMNEAEFLLRCTSFPQDFWEGSEEGGKIPVCISSPFELAKSFQDSEAGRALMSELEGSIKDAAGGGKERKRALNLTSFAQPTHRQLALLLGRGRKLVVRNPATLQRILSSIIFGVFIGTLFLHTSSNGEGTFTRAGYVLTMLFLMFLNSCMAPLDDLFHDRITFYTHRRANFYKTSSYYVSQVLCNLPVALTEAVLLSVLSFFAVGMESYGGAGFFYFLLLFCLVTICGTSVSRILAYSMPTSDVANSLGPAVLLFFVLTACYSPQYLDIPVWLRWIAWISPCAYCYEGVIVNELYRRDVETAFGTVSGNEFGQQAFGIPRIPYDVAPTGLNSPGTLMAFDAYMLVVIIIAFEFCGCVLLHYSQNWYGPTTKRYQVSSGMSLHVPAWTKSREDKQRARKATEVSDSVAVPEAPRAHLTAKNIVYDVDVSTPEPEPGKGKDKEKEKESGQNSVSVPSLNSAQLKAHDDEFREILVTSREYGQVNRGAAQEWMIRRALGASSLSSITMDASFASPTASLKTSVLDDKDSLEELDPPAPGRLRLLSGVTASFEPGSMTALMGSSGAGKSTLLDVLAGYKTGGYIFGDVNINGQAKTDATWRSIAGYCEQVDLHNPAMTVRESILFAARMRLRPFSLPDKDKIQFTNKILELLDLGEFADMLVGDEASGEGLPKHARKRLTVGVELAGNPSILFADEPTSGLDSLSASVVVESLARAAKRQDLTVVCTIHQPSREVFETFDNLLLLQKGGIVVYNGPVSELNTYMETVTGSLEYELPAGVNPADHVLDVFCGPRGSKEDWGLLYIKSTMAKDALASYTSCACASCQSGSISVDKEQLSTSAELWNVLQRQALAHWRTPSYMAVRFWWTVAANIIVGLVYLDAAKPTREGAINAIGSIFFYVNIATVPLLSAAVPLITERAVYYREVSSGTFGKLCYGIAVQLAEIPFNLVCALVSFVIFYFLVGLNTEPERVGYFILMSMATYWVLPSFGQLFAFLSPNIGAAVGTGSLIFTLFTLTMGFLIRPNDIPPWWIWIYWINPLRYILQGMVSNEIGGSSSAFGDEFLSMLGWSYSDRWWYCYVVVLLFGAASGAGILGASRISWVKR